MVGLSSDSRDNHLNMGFGKQMSLVRRLTLGGVAAAALGVAAVASANPPAPSIKPANVAARSVWIEAGDFSLLTRAMDAADSSQWSQVRSLLGRISDPGAQALVRWRILTDGSAGSGFNELRDALEEFKDWPDRDKIEDQMEILISRSGLTADDRIAWLSARGPRTSEGVLALTDAYNSQGRREDMVRVAREAWRTRPMSGDALRTLQAQFGSEFSQEDHYARADMFLWRGDTGSAQALLPKLSSGRKAVIEARVALIRNTKQIDKLVKAVPDAYADDAGLLYERARHAERRGKTSDEQSFLLRINGETAPAVGRENIWSEKQSVVRRMIRERNFSTAYQLAAGHGLSQGESFRDAEWMAGWLALSRLNDAKKAETHFRVFGAGVQTPISIARAQYWLGEALSAQGRAEEAQAAYVAGAKYPFVFYGQLAAEKAGVLAPELKMLDLGSHTAPTDLERADFARRPAVRASILLAESGRLASFERFHFALDDVLTTPVEHQMLFDIAAGYLEMRAAVRGAKAGLGRGIVAPDAVFPILPLPPSPRSGSAEPAMVLALSRQESEFNHRAISSADARGLMQMIPRYAQAEAKMVGIPFRASWLTDDPQYNLRLGRGFLDDLVDDYGGSYILAAAAYNAGPSRARQWIQDFGDPRAGTDPVDWIECIPFAETRNYVQRVLENTLVYRHRLTGQPVEITLSADLKRGRPR